MLPAKESEGLLNQSHYLQNSYFIHSYLQSEEEPKKIEPLLLLTFSKASTNIIWSFLYNNQVNKQLASVFNDEKNLLLCL